MDAIQITRIFLWILFIGYAIYLAIDVVKNRTIKTNIKPFISLLMAGVAINVISSFMTTLPDDANSENKPALITRTPTTPAPIKVTKSTDEKNSPLKIINSQLISRRNKQKLQADLLNAISASTNFNKKSDSIIIEILSSSTKTQTANEAIVHGSSQHKSSMSIKVTNNKAQVYFDVIDSESDIVFQEYMNSSTVEKMEYEALKNALEKGIKAIKNNGIL